MNYPDLINGSFEAVGGLAVWRNVAAIRRDRRVAGFDPAVSAFFTTWGIWNLYYYPHLSQWASFAGGVLIVLGNAVWVGLTIKVLREQQKV